MILHALKAEKKRRIDAEEMRRKTAARADEIREKCQSFLGFIEESWHVLEPTKEFVNSWSVAAIADHLQLVADGEIHLLQMNVPPGSMKPVHVDEMVLTKRGRIRLGNVIVGDEILTHLGRYQRVSAVHSQGLQETLTIKTDQGRVVRAEERHPFLTTRGWTEARDLKAGDILGAVIPQEDNFKDRITPEEARLMGYIVGDGGVTHFPLFTNMDEETLVDFEKCCASLGFGTARRKVPPSLAKKGMVATIIGMRGALRWLERHNLRGKSSYEKRIPDDVLASSNEIIANFLAAYWSCDGHVNVRHQRTRGSIYLATATTVCAGLAVDLQHALLRLGISARIRKRQVRLESKKQPGGIYTSYQILSSSHEDCVKFLRLNRMVARKLEPLRKLTPQKFVQGPLIEDEIISIERSGLGECRCLTVEIDHSFTASDLAVHNSLITSCMFGAYEWGPLNKPGLRYLTTSYKETLARRDSRKARDLIQSEWYRTLWPRVQLIRDGETSFENSFHGNREAWAFKSLTGGRGDRVLIDDPHSTESAESDNDRETARRVFRESVPSRVNDVAKDAIIVIMQRLHPQDVCGIIEELDLPYTKLIIPMEYTRSLTVKTPYFTDPRSEEGELMNPARFPRAEIEKMKVVLGPHAYDTQYQQQPRARDGSYFFSRENILVEHVTANGEKQFLPAPMPTICDGVYVVIDTATKVGKKRDGTGAMFVSYTVHPNKKAEILDWDIIQIEADLLITWLPGIMQQGEEWARKVGARGGFLGAFIEDKDSGQILLQQARRKEMNVHALDSKWASAGKDQRGVSAGGYVRNNMIKMTQPAYDKAIVWRGQKKNHAVEQITTFRMGVGTPNDSDELYDCFVYSCLIAFGDASEL